MANELLGQNRYLTAWSEDTWGSKPGSPVYFFLPVDEYGVKLNRKRRESQPYIGSRKRKHSVAYQTMPQGNVKGALYGFKTGSITTSIAEFIFTKALTAPTDNDLPSFGIEEAQGPDRSNKQHNGLRFNSFTVTGNDQSGRVEWSGDLMGKTESQPNTAQTIPNDLEDLVEFEFADSVLYLGSTAIVIASFQFQVNQNLKPAYLNSRTPTTLKTGGIDITFSFDIQKNSDTYDDAARASTETDLDVTLVLKGLHNGSLASDDYAQVTIDLPKCRLIDPDDKWSISDHTMTTVNTRALKPDSSTADMTVTWDTV